MTRALYLRGTPVPGTHPVVRIDHLVPRGADISFPEFSVGVPGQWGSVHQGDELEVAIDTNGRVTIHESGLYDRWIRTPITEGHEANLRRQLQWLGVCDEVFALQTLGVDRKSPAYLALCRSPDEAARLTTASGLKAQNRWGTDVQIDYQGIYVVPNRLVGRLDEVVEPGRWTEMPQGVITDERIACRRLVYLDLDTQRRDDTGRAVTLPISATRDELRATFTTSLDIRQDILSALHSAGVEDPASAVGYMMSGNGIQLWLRLDDIPESDALKHHVRALLAVWAVLYDSDNSHVDTAVHDAKRIAPLAGTRKKKGVNVSLHRPVTFVGSSNPTRISWPQLQALLDGYRHTLDKRQLAAVGKILGVRPKPRQHQQSTRSGSGSGSGKLQAANRIPIREVGAALGLSPEKPTCPGCGEGGTGTDVAYLDDQNVINCKHSRCSARPNRTPVDLVALVAFGCSNIAGTKGIASRVLAWFEDNFPGGAQ